ncbi:MAG: hypothetical protein FWE94_02300 [Coriobacteriia bacterium]|nr:hypothetical protein [Coriobacteriia bacterium]
MLARRAATFIGGVFLVLIGIPMLVCPGPGMLAIGTGFALITTGSLPARGDGTGRTGTDAVSGKRVG